MLHAVYSWALVQATDNTRSEDYRVAMGKLAHALHEALRFV